MRKATTLGALWISAAAGSLQAQEPVAMLVRVQGAVDLHRTGGEPVPAGVGSQLFAGDTVRPTHGARAILITRTGAQHVVTEATVVAEPRAVETSDLFARAVRTLANAASVDASTGGRQGMIRPVPGTTSLVAPRNGLVVRARQPTFTWTATPNLDYDFMLRKVETVEGQATGEPPAIYPVGVDTVFTLPDSAALDRGARYAWTVFPAGRREGRPLPQQDFRVMSRAAQVALEGYMDDIAVFDLDPLGDGLFLTVVAYRDLGLLYDAFEALEAVEEASTLSAEAYRLKGEILAAMGRAEEARAAFDRANELAG